MNKLIKNLLFPALLACIILAGCSGQKKTAEELNPPRTEEMLQGPVKLSIKIDPGKADFKRNTLVKISAFTDKRIEVEIPPLENRFQGFTPNETSTQSLQNDDGTVTSIKIIRLTPVIADEYRIAPIPIVYTDKRTAVAEKKWFATKPILLENTTKPDKKAGFIDTITTLWISPSLKTIIRMLVYALIAILLFFIVFILLKKIHRQIKLMRMSPVERALEELRELMAKDLIAKNLVKEFYIELTLVVRRFIERQYKIRAPEQTTEEFLAAVSKDPRFNAQTIEKLRSFLEAADLVKFAAYNPDPHSIENAISTAKDYIQSEAVTDAEKKAGQK